MTMNDVPGERTNGCGCGAAALDMHPHTPSFTYGLSLLDPPPLLTAAIDACAQAVTRLTGTIANADNPAHASRELVRRETGVDVDANPYHGITRDKLEAVIRAAFHARAMPEVLLAKWAKEGSTRMTTGAQAVTQASTAANARTLLRSSIYYRQLGVDWLTVTRRPDPHGDNVLDETDSGAAAQETHFAARVAELVRGGVLAEDIAARVNAELTVTSSGGTYAVQPSVRFYALSLLLVDAVFARFLRMTFPELPTVGEELGYMLWNMGEASFRTFLRSADGHRREPAFLVNGQPISIEQWALHTHPRANEYAQARTNAIRFAHYIRAYRPIFRGAMDLIKPGISDLRNITAHMASFEDDPLGIGAPRAAVSGSPAPNLPVRGRETTARAASGPVPGGGRGAMRHAPLGGDPGDNVELRWNVPAGTAANATIDIVVHLHGYGTPSATFLADKARAAGVLMVDASGNANVRTARPTLALVPRGRYTRGSTWLFDNLPDTRAFQALVDAGLAHLASSVLRLPPGSTLRQGRCTLMAHSGGGAGLSALLRAGVDPDEVVCFDSMYGGEAPIRTWALARLASPRAASSGLRAFYTGCSGPSAAHPAGEWAAEGPAQSRRWVYRSPGSWTFRSGVWRLITTEVSSRRLKDAIDLAVASSGAAASLGARFRVERTSVRHGDIPARYTPPLLDDIAANAPGASPAPAASTRPVCVANNDWLTNPPQKPGGNAPPPPRPTAAPASATSASDDWFVPPEESTPARARSYGYENGHDEDDGYEGEASYGLDVACSISGANIQCGTCTATERRVRGAAGHLVHVPTAHVYGGAAHADLTDAASDALVRMRLAAIAAGVITSADHYLKLLSGYRDYASQTGIWRTRLRGVFDAFGCTNWTALSTVVDATNTALASTPPPYAAGTWLTRFRTELANAGISPAGCDPARMRAAAAAEHQPVPSTGTLDPVELAVRIGRQTVAPPGASPHHTGRAADLYLGSATGFRATSSNATNVAWQRQRPWFQWLVCNASTYGYFPYNREPWHWEHNPPAS
ncbi:D-alanyl-D-alanine carboxypeptidase family protein [Pendulispora albinea]|uniref:D-alanyl-D-alanine carboxypeptidase family protein n=1 Tax=Pendulispora albinea TaxID=2741071 RepID=A0ABZ2M133_9BACT